MAGGLLLDRIESLIDFMLSVPVVPAVREDIHEHRGRTFDVANIGVVTLHIKTREDVTSGAPPSR